MRHAEDAGEHSRLASVEAVNSMAFHPSCLYTQCLLIFSQGFQNTTTLRKENRVEKHSSNSLVEKAYRKPSV